MNVKIISAGSIGNHLLQASRRMGWDVVVTDIDPKALERTKSEIYPSRYGVWDEAIKLYKSGEEPKGGYDIIMIGTPPDVRMRLAREALEENPKLLHLEKPLCPPDLRGVVEFEKAMSAHPETIVTVGYDHAVAESVEYVAGLLEKKVIGNVFTIDVEFREHWRGIFAAHPWLAGPQDTYLGYWRRGGGAGGEHSHALHLWLHFARALGWGGIRDAKVVFDMQKERDVEYDRLAAFLLTAERGGVGRVVQDVITFPVRKWARLQGDNGFIEWCCNGVPEGDLVRHRQEEGDMVETVFAKKRPDDFYRETLHYKDLLEGKIRAADSPLAFERGLEVMRILQRAYGV